jgi:hypothetical protein
MRAPLEQFDPLDSGYLENGNGGSMNVISDKNGMAAQRDSGWGVGPICGFVCVVLMAVLILCSPTQAQPVSLRIGHFPNITHIQALVAHGLSRKGQGWFEKRLGSEVTVEWFLYNAGPSAMEAIFADAIDVAYVGPSPAKRKCQAPGRGRARSAPGSSGRSNERGSK